MNIERLEQLKDFLAGQTPAFQFEIGEWYYETPTCGTVGCIAGAAIHIWGAIDQKRIAQHPSIDRVGRISGYGGYHEWIVATAGEILGLPASVAKELFCHYPSGNVGRPEAIRAIDNVIHGKDPW